jgi:hypothetical protein
MKASLGKGLAQARIEFLLSQQADLCMCALEHILQSRALSSARWVQLSHDMHCCEERSVPSNIERGYSEEIIPAA